MARKPKPVTRAKIKSVDAKYIGDEPTVLQVHTVDDIAYIRALSWYNYSCDGADAHKWLSEYLDNELYSKDIRDKLKKCPDWSIPTTLGWMARMITNGTIMPEGTKKIIDDKLQSVIKQHYVIDEPKNEEVKKVVDIQSKVLLKFSQLFTQAEEMIDSEKIDMYDFLKRNEATPAASNYIRAKYLPCLNEILSDDDQVKESYGKSLKKWQLIYQTIIDDCDRYTGNKKAAKVRKPRTVKEKPISKLIEKLKFQKEDLSLKLASVNPIDIIGAQSLWVYNTKYKVLTVYNATPGANGFSVKGTTLMNFDAEKSIGKTLRKPEITLADVLSAGRVALRSLMDNIKTAQRNPNGRINEDTILLRIVK